MSAHRETLLRLIDLVNAVQAAHEKCMATHADVGGRRATEADLFFADNALRNADDTLRRYQRRYAVEIAAGIKELLPPDAEPIAP